MAGAVEWRSSLASEMASAKRKFEATYVAVAAAWWFTRLQYYEVRTKKSLIVYPRSVCFEMMYDNEFVPEMRAIGVLWKTREPREQFALAGGDGTVARDVGSGEGGGSMTSWRRGQQLALQQLADEKVGPGSAPFKFESRRKHSMYKECKDCQDLRLDYERAIKERAPKWVIDEKKDKQLQHLQKMYLQRAKMDQLIQLCHHEGFCVENSDKCGDGCLHQPHMHRISSSNAGLYQFKVALQANVFSAKLMHLLILLPNLKTGEDFGITSALCGLCRMIDLGQLQAARRTWLRGMDGGSENVNLASLGMNCTLVGKSRTFDSITQSRLPPDHSHHWTTDGTFSVIEGWLSMDGFPGTSTVWELIDYLRSQFQKADGYKQHKVEITCLLVTYAFNKWFAGCINADKLNRIGIPLVWRHTWIESTQTVLNQYKMLISDVGSFEKDEWGPWVEKVETFNDPVTGKVESKVVLRSDPNGVDIMHHYPDLDKCPGVTDWLDDDSWKRERVFYDLAKYRFNHLSQAEGAKRREEWAALDAWLTAHPTSSTVLIGAPNVVAPGCEFQSTLPPWRDMWTKLRRNVPEAHAAPQAGEQRGGIAPGDASTSRRRYDLERLSKSTSAAEVNIVTHPGYSEQARRVAHLNDSEKGKAHLVAELPRKDALFFVELEPEDVAEGELRIGVCRRQFDERVDEPAGSLFSNEDARVCVLWYERKGWADSHREGWGQQPSFRPAKGAYIGNTRKRLDVHASLKLVSRFLPVILQQTNKSSTANVVLTKNCMTALREYIEKERPYLIATTPVPTVSEVDISLSRVNGALGLSFDLRNRVLQVTEGQAAATNGQFQVKDRVVAVNGIELASGKLVQDVIPAGDAPILFRVHRNVDVAQGRGPAAATQEEDQSSPNDVASSSDEDQQQPCKQAKIVRKKPTRVVEDDDE